MNECNCTLTEQLVGDGCEICNPVKALEYAKQTIKALEQERAEVKELLEGIISCIENPMAKYPDTIEYIYREVSEFLETL